MRKSKLFILALAAFVSSSAWGQWTDITNGDGLSFTSKVGFGTPAVKKSTVYEIWTDNASAAFDLNQTVTDIPEGIYELSANAMYRASLNYGTATNCILYATTGSDTYSAPIKNYGDCTASESHDAVANAIVNHKAYSTSIPYIVVKNGTATIGMKSTSALTYCTNGYWFIYNSGSFTFKNVTEAYYSKLSARATEMLSNAAEGEAKTALNTALDTYSSATVDNIEALKAAINTYLWTAASDANPIDITSYMANPSFDGGSLKYWMQDFGYTQCANMYQPNDWDLCYSSKKVSNTANQTLMPQEDGAKDGYCLYVRHRWSDVLAIEDIRQTVKELPAGKYTLTVAVKGTDVADKNTLTLSAGANTNTTTISTFNDSYTDYSVTVIKNDAATDLNICYGLKQETSTGSNQNYYIDDFRLYYNGEIVSDEDAAALIASIPDAPMFVGIKDAMQSAKEALESSKSLSNYKALSAAIEAAKTSIADYVNLKSAIESATKYTVVNESYNGLSTAISTAQDIYDNGSAESCTDAITALENAVKAAKVADYNYVADNYAYPVELGTWQKDGPTGELTSQHWSGEAKPYLEQSSAAWSQNSWTIGYSQDLTLPTGSYVFKVAGRKAAGNGCTLELVVKNGDTTIGSISNFPEGDTGLGINKAGATSFDPSDSEGFANGNNGRGFEWRYVKFTLAEDATVNIAVNANATTSHQWVSFCDATIQTNNEANIAMIAYNIALNDAKLAIDNDTYTNVTGSEKNTLQDAIDADMTDKTKDDIEAATTALKNATTAFTAAAPAYDNFVAILAKVDKLDTDGQSAFNTALNDVLEKYNDHTVNAEALENSGAADILINAIKAQGANSDWTGLIVNPSFEDQTGTFPNGWTTDKNTTGTWDYKLIEETLNTYGTTDGKYVLNAWASQINYINVKQGISLPAGVYELSAAVYSDQISDQHIEAIVGVNNYKSETVPLDQWTTLTTTFIVPEGGAYVTVGIFSTGNNINGDTKGWFRADNFKLKYIDEAGANMKITDAKYATFCAPFNVEIPEGVTASKVTGVNDNLLTLDAISATIPANTPVVLFSESPVNKIFTGKKVSGTPTEGLLTGVYENTEINEGYVLVNRDDVAKFAIVGSTPATVPANRAYLTVSSGAKEFFLEEATGIDKVEVNGQQSTVNGIFNLAGQKVGNDYKGIVIMNGKKYLNK